MAAMIRAERPDTAEAQALIAELDAYLAPLYPPESNHGLSVEKLLDESVTFFLLWVDEQPAGCGGLQIFGADYAEIKRMYIRPRYRSLGLGRMLLDHLCVYARQEGMQTIRLETGIHQPESIRLYERYGFQPIGPFGFYQEDPLSLFYEIHLEQS